MEISKPRLWWPRSLGDQALYTAKFRCEAEGLRQVDVDSKTYGFRTFIVNGHRMFLRGGNWIGTDAMFRYSTDPKRYRDEVRLHAEANLDLIRVWGGGITERSYFYDACDEYGMLAMQDFWISGEYPDPTKGKNWEAIFIASARDNIKRLRNRPSLLFWSGGNEQEIPPDTVANNLGTWFQPLDADTKRGTLDIVPLDPTRICVNRSTAIASDNTEQYNDGPYEIMDPALLFKYDRSSNGDNGWCNPINPEIGVVGMPGYESVVRMIPEKRYQFPNYPKDDKNIPAAWLQRQYKSYIGKRDGVDP
jgi:mannosylglycoprotein endo-beta-mannosidase